MFTLAHWIELVQSGYGVNVQPTCNHAQPLQIGPPELGGPIFEWF